MWHCSNKTFLLLTIGAILFFVSCEKQSYPQLPMAWPEMLACHDRMIWDSNKIKDTLTGKWDWYTTGCPFLGSGVITYSGLSVEFFPDGTFEVRQDEILSESGTWNILEATDAYVIHTEPFMHQVEGRIMFCDNFVRFHNDQVEDLCETYFTRRI